ncbi:MAG: hypothetical protein AAFQ80_16205 [Cyanobacteria bacterium J06621_8]
MKTVPVYFEMSKKTFIPNKLGNKFILDKLTKYLDYIEKTINPKGSFFNIKFLKRNKKFPKKNKNNQKTELKINNQELYNQEQKLYNQEIEFEINNQKPLELLKTIEKNSNGLVNFIAFESYFFKEETGVLTSLENSGDLDHPLFAVVDHNSAHHMSYILAKWGFSRFSSHKKKVVINFDQHEDYGSPKSKEIACSTWGNFILRRGQDSVADAYVVVGVRNSGKKNKDENTLIYTKQNKDTVSSSIKKTELVPWRKYFEKQDENDGLLEAIFNELNKLEENKEWSQWDVYITVDRDVMIGSFTSYGDGSYESSKVQEKIGEYLNQLSEAGVNLVGFDVIGLPDKQGKSDKVTENEAVVQAINNLKSFYDAIAEYKDNSSGRRKDKSTSPKQLSISQSTIFPTLSSGLATSLSKEPILLNGMKVIFDQQASVYPVDLQLKNKKLVNTSLAKSLGNKIYKY